MCGLLRFNHLQPPSLAKDDDASSFDDDRFDPHGDILSFDDDTSL